MRALLHCHSLHSRYELSFADCPSRLLLAELRAALDCRIDGLLEADGDGDAYDLAGAYGTAAGSPFCPSRFLLRGVCWPQPEC